MPVNPRVPVYAGNASGRPIPQRIGAPVDRSFLQLPPAFAVALPSRVQKEFEFQPFETTVVATETVQRR